MERIIINQVCAGQILIMMNKGSVVQIWKRYKWPYTAQRAVVRSVSSYELCMVLHGIAWYCMVFQCIAWYCMVLHGILWYCMVLHDIAWYCMVLHSIAWYYMVLHGVAWYYMVLAIARYCMVYKVYMYQADESCYCF